MEIPNLDQKILQTARKQFSEKGILKCEMKDIAAELGCGRSTLYRHFSSKEEILFQLAQNALCTIFDSIKIPEGLRFSSSYEALEWQINRYVETMICHSEEVLYLRDFDCFFTKDYPDIKAAREYVEIITSGGVSDVYSLMMQRYEDGVKDGSIKSVDNPRLMMLTILQSCLALAQKVMPREDHFIQEHGYGQEILRCHAKVLLAMLKNS